MSVNKRRNKYKTDKEFDKEQSEDGFVSKTQLKNQALDLKKFGLELAKLKTSIIENLPVGEVTLKSLTDYQKMTTNLARKRHLMFIGKCLRSESESAIREYLDNKERKNFAKSPHEYLITQLQEINESVTMAKPNIRLNFNHPTKELIWIIQEDAAVEPNVNDWTNYEVVNQLTLVLLLETTHCLIVWLSLTTLSVSLDVVVNTSIWYNLTTITLESLTVKVFSYTVSL